VSDETPQDPATPDTPASTEPPAAPETPTVAETPTEEAPVAASTVAAPTAPVAAPAPAVPPKERKVVAVPLSLLAVVGAILVAALMFGIGYAVGDSNDGGSQAVSRPEFQIPGIGDNGNNGNGNNGNNGNGDDGNRAVPSNTAFLGVAAQQADGGVRITQVVPDSAADDAGLEVGDVITEFDGDEISTPAELGTAVADHDPGDRVEVTFTRDGQSDTVNVTLTSRAQSN
jgi:membrane-associated protease RseP (regulator of RpoE activity)